MKKHYRQHQQFFKNGLIIKRKDNNLSHYKLFYPYLFRIINKKTARKHYNIMKHISITDKIKIEGMVMDNEKQGYEYSTWRRTNITPLYKNLTINLPPKYIRAWVHKNIKVVNKKQVGKLKVVRDKKTGEYRLLLKPCDPPRIEEDRFGTMVGGLEDNPYAELTGTISIPSLRSMLYYAKRIIIGSNGRFRRVRRKKHKRYLLKWLELVGVDISKLEYKSERQLIKILMKT
jgi:hypothetical protein